MGVSVIFAVLGLGVILRKEVARKGTIYFSFFIVVLALLSVLLNPRSISHAIMQLIYPGILIYYFTSEKSIKYFNPRKKTVTKGEG